MSYHKMLLTALVLLVALLAACSPAGNEPAADTSPTPTQAPSSEETETPATETPAPDPGEVAQAAAVAHLAQELGVPAAEIEVISVEHTEFTDSCLGLGGPAESCLMVMTPGWLIIVRAQEKVYEVHVSEDGSQVRFVETADPTEEYPFAVVAARQTLAKELDLPVEEITVVSFERAEFSDSCLGLGGPAESCLQVITPGWLAMLEAQGETYEVRADETGQQVRIAGLATESPGPPVDMQGAAVYYEISGGVAGSLERYYIHEDGSVEQQIGPPGSMSPIKLFEVEPERVARLIADLDEADFFALDGSMPVVPCCDRRVYIVAVSVGEQENTIYTMDGHENPPPGVLESLQLVQSFIAELEAAGGG